MLYTPATKKAMKLCFAAHKDQMDKNGVPYVFHPFHLADVHYQKHMLPQTDDILNRAVNISIGVVDKGLGSGCGININSSEEEINAVAKHIREVIESL